MDTQAHPGKGLSLSQLIFALNEELKRSVYSPSYVAKHHREACPAGVLQEDSTLTRSIASRSTRFLNLTGMSLPRWRPSASGGTLSQKVYP